MKSIFSFFLVILSFTAFSQQPSFDAAEIEKQIEKLGVLNRVLYFAAHPDDENTRLIAYLSKGKNVETAYFSLTRGDGGQNLIGDEKGSLLGVIRTQELLQARKIDGGTQYFSRAIDFGYSKSAQETFKHWEKDSLLADAVLVIRKFKPDVIVTRFPPDSRAGHGHHTVSAIIAAEAFDAAADPSMFPESAKKYGSWTTQKLYWNESTWWNKTIADHSEDYETINIGEYDSQLGVSYSEIASKSRSQHQSQGFGMSIQRGDKIEYLKFLKGDSTKNGVIQNEFRSWSDIEGGKSIDKQWKKILEDFDPQKPKQSIESLTELYFALIEMPENPYKDTKAGEVKNLIATCGGLWIDFRSSQPLIVKGENFDFTTYAISQSNFPFELKTINVHNKEYTVGVTLGNTYSNISDTILAPTVTSTPYWLKNENNGDVFIVNNRNLISQPENNPVLSALFTFQTPQGDLVFERPLLYKWTDKVRGELYRTVNVVEPMSVEFDKKVTLAQKNTITVKVRANKVATGIKVQLNWGKEFENQSSIYTIDKLTEGQTTTLIIALDSSINNNTKVNATVWENEEFKLNKSLVEIKYPHIPTQVVLPPAKVILIKEEIQVTRKNIGYIIGSGDEIPTALKELGCTVTILDPNNITLEQLQSYDGVVVGIRCYNKVEAMKSVAPILNQYVFKGGFVLVQYNTNRGLVTEDIGPYPLKLSRTRVTEEDSKVVRLQRSHPILQTPNLISDTDFDNWVQERGLYFAGEWDEHYQPIIGWNDTNEDLAKGSLLVTNYGDGHYIFTGISFFRQLPAGVVGAYKLFANLISFGATNQENIIPTKNESR